MQPGKVPATYAGGRWFGGTGWVVSASRIGQEDPLAPDILHLISSGHLICHHPPGIPSRHGFGALDLRRFTVISAR